MVKRVKTCTIYDPVYRVDVKCFQGPWKVWVKRVKRLDQDLYDAIIQQAPLGAVGMSGAFTYPTTKGPRPKRATFVVFLEPGARVETLSHELLHAAIGVLELAGFNPGTVAQSEPLTYYHDWLVREGKRGLRL